MDEDGAGHTGLTASWRLAADRNRWEGELTGDKIALFLFCVMPFIGRAFSAFLTFFKLTPDMLLNVIECAKDPDVFQIGNVVFRQIPCIVLLYFVISIILLPFVYRNYHCYGLKK